MLPVRNGQAPEDKLQAQRFELKYRIPAGLAPLVRDFVSSYLVLDEYSAGQRDNSYYNHSLYLDSPDLMIYWDVINSNKNRYKLRVRYYDDEPETPVFFEIKRRMNDAILKQRGPVRRKAVTSLLTGQVPGPEHLFSDRPQHLVAVQQFCRLMHELQAVPMVHVAYRREAWVSAADNSVRVTLDREICTAPHSTPDITTRIEGYVMPFEPTLILELKFTRRFPNWFGELVQVFHLMQCGAAKYADGVAFMGEHRLNSNWLPHETGDRVERALRRRERRHRNPSDPPLNAASV